MPTPATPIQEDVTLAPHTTIKLGGKARYFAACQTEDELRESLRFAHTKHIPVHILGGGSNTIFADSGFPGLVIKIDLRGISESVPGELTVQAGEPWDPLVERCVTQNLAGLECLSGIPGLVGATPMQNVGAYGQSVAETIQTVTAIEQATGKTHTFTASECEFRYRSSRFKTTDQNRFIITTVTFRLTPNGPATIRYPQVTEALAATLQAPSQPTLAEVRAAVLALRHSKSMVVDTQDPNTRSCGSFFTNPILSTDTFAAHQAQYHYPADIPVFATNTGYKIPAAWLIEHAGFPRGTRRGGVGISANHNLALININGTTAELLQFAQEIRSTVQQKFGITLEQEPVTIPPQKSIDKKYQK